MEEEKGAIAQILIDEVHEIATISDYRCTVKKQYCNLSRRLKLLIPMFEEIRDGREVIPHKTLEALVSFRRALELAKEMLRFGSEGSKIYLVLKREQIMNKYHDLCHKLEQALHDISYDKLDLSDEVKEQVDLVLAQFRRAKGRVEPPDTELYEDLLSLYTQSSDSATLRRLAEKLQLTGISDLAQESIALHEMVNARGDDPGKSIEMMSMSLKKLKDFMQTEIPDMDAAVSDEELSSSFSKQKTNEMNYQAQVIPDDFRCPISLELMKDPVIVSTGQTYERSCIEKWLEAGHAMCPKTRQSLSSTSLTPNYVLRSIIVQWCEANGIEPPKRSSSSCPSRSASSILPADCSRIETLLYKLKSRNLEDQRSAAGEIRLLAKHNRGNRVAIAEAGAIHFLVLLLSAPDSRTQEHAVTALLNLSICENNKGRIISSGAIPGIVHVLKNGSTEARENAAAALFSLSVVDENKATIGSAGAIPPLVTLLSEGTQQGKKDAATALFNLCIYQGNRGKAVRAGAVPTLMRLLKEPLGGMVDETLAILAILSSHPEGKTAIGSEEAVAVLVELIRNGSPRNKENAAAVLVHLCSADMRYLKESHDLGVMCSLVDISQNGTERGKRKAAQLLARMNRFHLPQLIQSQTELQPHGLQA